MVKGTSREPVNELLIGHFWMAVCRLEARVWLEYIDSRGNWSDGISRKFETDKFVLDRKVRVRKLHDPFCWMREDAAAAWASSERLLSQ